MSKTELLLFLSKNDCRYDSYFLNGKKYSFDKLAQVVKNNLNTTEFEVREKKATMPFFKGDYQYFMNYSTDSKMSRMEKMRVYITAK